MDTKSRSIKPFLVWMCFFLGINIVVLMLMGALYVWQSGSFDVQDVRAVWKGDYKNYSRFKAVISNHYANLVRACVLPPAGDPQKNLTSLDSEGDNLIYQAKNLKNGRVITNSEKEIGFSPQGLPVLPEGYDYYLYFDGERLLVNNGGKLTDISRNNSGYWGYGTRAYLSDTPSESSYYSSEELAQLRILLVVKQDITVAPEVYRPITNAIETGREFKWQMAAICTVFLAGLGLLVFSILQRKRKREFTAALARFTGWFWLEVKLAASLIVLAIFFNIIFTRMWDGGYFEERIAVLFFFSWWCYLALVDLWHNRRRVFSNNSINSLIKLYRKLEGKRPFQKYMLQRAYLLVAAEALLIFFVVIFLIAVVTGGQPGFFLPMLILTAAGIYLVYRYLRRFANTVNDLGKIIDRIEAVKNGDMTAQNSIHSDGDLYAAEENLNLIREGISRAVDDRTRSERMKVELITNVSHDLKTPLTSIISYVDLLQKEEGLPAHVQDYIGILSGKSDRLKTLIQDLFELSRAASGEMKTQMEDLDLCKLIRQTLADMNEQIVQSGLVFKTNIPEEPAYVVSDGNRLYRVFQNIFSNALKYSLTGSRVYVDLLVDANAATAVIKNTANYEMNFTEEEIIERFVRGDQSRSTEGSGLGLAIAKSFTQACGGRFNVRVDGDQFKVVLSFDIRKA